MPFVYEVMKEEYERLSEKMIDYTEKLSECPKGSIVQKKINNKIYHYLVYRDKDKVKTKYIKKDEIEILQEQIERRERIKKAIASGKIDIKLLEKVVGKNAKK